MMWIFLGEEQLRGREEEKRRRGEEGKRGRGGKDYHDWFCSFPSSPEPEGRCSSSPLPFYFPRTLLYPLLTVLTLITACTGSGGGDIQRALLAVGVDKEIRFFLNTDVQPGGPTTVSPKASQTLSNTVLDLQARFLPQRELWVLLADRIQRYSTANLSETPNATNPLPAPEVNVALNNTCEEGSYLRFGPTRVLIVCLQKDPNIPKLFSLPIAGTNPTLETAIDLSSLSNFAVRSARFTLGSGDGLIILQLGFTSPEFIFWPSRINPGNPSNAVTKPITPSISGAILRDLIYENTGDTTRDRAIAVIASGNSTILASWNLQSGSTPDRGEKAVSLSRLVLDTQNRFRVLFGTALGQLTGLTITDYPTSVIGALNLGAGVIGFDGFFYSASNDTSNNYLLTVDLQTPVASLRSGDFRKVTLDQNNVNARASSVAYVQTVATTP